MTRCKCITSNDKQRLLCVRNEKTIKYVDKGNINHHLLCDMEQKVTEVTKTPNQHVMYIFRILYSIMSEKFLLSYFPLNPQCQVQFNCSFNYMYITEI